MVLRLNQDYEYKREDWWEWSVWVDGPQQELDQIKYVEYTLHPTFPRPVRRIFDRSSGFRLQTAGWGRFTIFAKIVHDGGEETLLEHFLQLTKPEDDIAPA
jgi:transcription initiation factor IIF auxiliary subunit